MCQWVCWGLADLPGLGWLDQLQAVGPAELGSLPQVRLKSAPHGFVLESKIKKQELFLGRKALLMMTAKVQERRLSHANLCQHLIGQNTSHGQSQG